MALRGTSVKLVRLVALSVSIFILNSGIVLAGPSNSLDNVPFPFSDSESQELQAIFKAVTSANVTKGTIDHVHELLTRSHCKTALRR
jgi:hypothetical protein